jgi:hypothetical protein
MDRPEQMVMDSQSPMVTLNRGLSYVSGCTGCLPSTGEYQILPGLQMRHPAPASRSLSRHGAVRCFPKIVFRSAVDCLAMALCVLFAALATLLMGL